LRAQLGKEFKASSTFVGFAKLLKRFGAAIDNCVLRRNAAREQIMKEALQRADKFTQHGGGSFTDLETLCWQMCNQPDEDEDVKRRGPKGLERAINWSVTQDMFETDKETFTHLYSQFKVQEEDAQKRSRKRGGKRKAPAAPVAAPAPKRGKPASQPRAVQQPRAVPPPPAAASDDAGDDEESESEEEAAPVYDPWTNPDLILVGPCSYTPEERVQAAALMKLPAAELKRQMHGAPRGVLVALYDLAEECKAELRREAAAVPTLAPAPAPAPVAAAVPLASAREPGPAALASAQLCSLCHCVLADTSGSLGVPISVCCGLPLPCCAKPSLQRVHYECALWSSRVVQAGRSAALKVCDSPGLAAEVRRSTFLSCHAGDSVCCAVQYSRHGATLGCYKKACRAVFHLPCARNVGCQFGVGGNAFDIACPKHRTDGKTGPPAEPEQEDATIAEEKAAEPSADDGAAAGAAWGGDADDWDAWDAEPEMEPAAVEATEAACAADALGAHGCYLRCEDLSAEYGTAERVPVPVVVRQMGDAMPPRFRYITQREGVERVAGPDWQGGAISCSCPEAGCGGGTRGTAQCEHIQQFDEDFPEAVDVAGRTMRGRLPYKPYWAGAHRVCVLAHDSFAPVHECNANCSCCEDCRSRVMQHGLRARLFVRPARRHAGWAVHAAAPIPAGAFIAEYVGEVIGGEEADARGCKQDKEGVSYLFSIDSHVEQGSNAADVFTLDAAHAGNVARFVNHSCAPNCRIRSVIWDSSDPRLAHLALFALRDIEAGEELTYNYGYTVKKGSKKGIECKCGASACRKWLVTF
jgi:hypothetical protein